MFSETTINDHLDKTRRTLGREIEALNSSVDQIYSEHNSRGILISGITISRVWAEAIKHASAGYDKALLELQRTIRSTKLDPKELRNYTVSELENFKLQVEAIAREKTNVVQGRAETISDQKSTELVRISAL